MAARFYVGYQYVFAYGTHINDVVTNDCEGFLVSDYSQNVSTFYIQVMHLG